MKKRAVADVSICVDVVGRTVVLDGESNLVEDAVNELPHPVARVLRLKVPVEYDDDGIATMRVQAIALDDDNDVTLQVVK